MALRGIAFYSITWNRGNISAQHSVQEGSFPQSSPSPSLTHTYILSNILATPIKFTSFICTYLLQKPEQDEKEREEETERAVKEQRGAGLLFTFAFAYIVQYNINININTVLKERTKGMVRFVMSYHIKSEQSIRLACIYFPFLHSAKVFTCERNGDKSISQSSKT